MTVLTPSHIFCLIKYEIDKTNYNNYKEITKKFDILIDVIVAAIRIYDTEAIRDGLKIYSDEILYYISDNNKIISNKKYLYDKHFFLKQTLTLFNSSNCNNYIVAIMDIITLLENMGKKSVEKESPELIYGACLNLTIIGMNIYSINADENYHPINAICNITFYAIKEKKKKISQKIMNSPLNIQSITDMSEYFLSSLIEYLSKNTNNYSKNLASYGLIKSLVENYEEGIWEYPFTQWIVDKIYDLNINTKSRIFVNLDEYNYLWNGTSGFEPVKAYLELHYNDYLENLNGNYCT